MEYPIKDFFLELAFPSFCLACRKEGTYLCLDCKSTLEVLEHTYCLCSKHPFRLPPKSVSGKCSRCQGKKLAGLSFALSYGKQALARKLIYQFKYPPHITALAPTIAGLIVEHLVRASNNGEDFWNSGVLVPVPMEKKKLRQRGYNQAEILARHLSTIIKTPVETNVLVKIKRTGPQMELSAAERQKNIDGAFSVKNPKAIAGKKVFLVDDVYTTGSTMEACAAILKSAGAASVWGIAIAREE